MTGQVTDLLDVFNSYDGGVLFAGLTTASGAQPPILAKIGWIFTAGGALMVLWGFVLRTRHGGGDDRLGEIVRTWVVIAAMLGGPLFVRAAMQAADGIYSTTIGGPWSLITACVKAASALPEMGALVDSLRQNALDGTSSGTAGAQRQALIGNALDGSILGYLEAFGYSVWDTALSYTATAKESWTDLVRTLTLFNALGASTFKCALIFISYVPLLFLFLASAAIQWFMVQMRYFLAVTGTMMLPLFVGMFSLPAGHPSRQTGHAYVMNMLSLTLWPVAWTIGHTGTIAFYNALISLISGTSRVTAMVDVLQWNAVTGASGLTETQLHSLEAALGNWFMGDTAALLALPVGGLGFAVWVFVVAIAGPALLHRALSAGGAFMADALSRTGSRMVATVSFGASAPKAIRDTVASARMASSIMGKQPSGTSGTGGAGADGGGGGSPGVSERAKSVPIEEPVGRWDPSSDPTAAGRATMARAAIDTPPLL